jgi:hypothetical protein
MENDELPQLKTVYDELWSDAKTMIKDVTGTIKVVYSYSALMFVIAILMFLSAHQTYMKIILGSTRTLDYFYLAAESFFMIIMIVAGIWCVRWYNKLKNRYSRIIQLEKTFED